MHKKDAEPQIRNWGGEVIKKYYDECKNDINIQLDNIKQN